MSALISLCQQNCVYACVCIADSSLLCYKHTKKGNKSHPIHTTNMQAQNNLYHTFPKNHKGVLFQRIVGFESWKQEIIDTLPTQ